MPKYVKKPIEIEAVQFIKIDDNNRAVFNGELYQWLHDAILNHTVDWNSQDAFVTTLEGELMISKGDFIIQGVKGELYPCKPDIFAATYEEVK